MKKFVYFIALFLSVAMFNSCKEKVVIPAPEVNDFTASLNDKDTLQMLKICDDCMELLKAGDIETVVSSLYEYNDSLNSVAPISEEAAYRFRRQTQLFPVHEYQRVSYRLFDEGLNDVKYEIVFGEAKNGNANSVPKTFFMFNPVKIDGKWYLCVKRSDQRING